MTDTPPPADADRFPFVTVATSMIIGLGLTQVLGGIAKLIQLQPPGRLHPEHVAWLLIVGVLHVQVWWTTYEARVATWTFGRFARYLLPPTLLYLMAELLVPDDNAERVHYADYFAGVSRPFFALAAAFCVSTWLDTTRNHAERRFAKSNLYRLVAALALLPASAIANPTYRTAITTVATGLLVLFLIARYGREGAGDGDQAVTTWPS